MAAATKDREGMLDPVHGVPLNSHDVPVAAATVIFAYTLVSTNAAGFLVPAADVAGQAGRQVLQALNGADNSAGANGEISVRCMIRGMARMDTGALTQAAVGLVAHVADDQTLAASSVNTRPVGRVVAWSASRTDVQIG